VTAFLQTLAGALHRTGFADRVERRRRRARSAYAPFCRQVGGVPAPDRPRGNDGDLLVGLLHDGVPVRGALDPRLAKALVGADFADDGLAPGRWELTAFRGLVAVRDRAAGPGAGQVYIGEDSLRFAEAILDAAPHGLVLDVGAGSGLTGCALARSSERVLCVDVLDECLAATTVSAALNGLTERVDVVSGRFQDLDLDRPGRFNCIAANLPYVPVPAGLAYSPAGNGGPDGLGLIRSLLKRAVELLDPHDGALVMRLASLGDERGPLLLLDDLRGFAAATGYDVVVVADGRVPYELRAALTAKLAGRHNPDRDPVELLDVASAHLRGYGLPLHLACGLVARSGGTGRVDVVNLAAPLLLDRPVAPSRPVADVLAARDRIAAGYWRASRDLPDGFWELGTEREVLAPLERMQAVVRALADGATVRVSAERVFADMFAADPVRARSLLLTVELLVQQLLDCRLATARPGR
jgi:methyltransferase family protein